MRLENGQILFTFIMPTLNSEKTIDKALRSIRSQRFPQEQVEILVIDGGSSDNTISIAEKYGVIILKNVQKIPETAKAIGLRTAKGRWIVLHDSDEVFISDYQLMDRYHFFLANPDVYCYVANKLLPGDGCGISCAYLNIVSDPFGYIVYKNKGAIIKNNRQFLYKKNKGNIYKYTETAVTPIGDGGTTTFNIEKAKELFGDRVYTQEFAVSAFIQLVNKTSLVGCIPDDNIIHFSTATFKSYLKKLKFRININLNNVEKSGYSARARYSRKLQQRKKWFVIYCMTLIGPFFDSIRLAVMNKRLSLSLHFVYTYYVFFIAIWEVLKKSLNIKGTNYSYGK